MTFLRHTATLTAAAGLLALAGCAADDAAPASESAEAAPATSDSAAAVEPTDVTVVLDWTPNTNHTGLYLALANGWFEDAGLAVTVIEPGETDGLQLVATGQAEFAYSVAEGLLPARVAGADVVSVATVIEHNTSSLISLSEDGIERPRDLEGTRYGSYGSDLETAIIDALVACDGGDPSLVEHTPLVSYDFRIGLSEDQFETAWVFDAWDTIRLGEIDGLDVSTLAFRDYTDCVPDWYTPLLATSRDVLEGDPDTVRAFLKVLTRGYQAAMTDPAAGAEALLAAAPELDPELVELSAAWLADRYADDPASWGVQTEETWTRFAEWLMTEDLIDGDPDVADAWTNDYLPESA